MTQAARALGTITLGLILCASVGTASGQPASPSDLEKRLTPRLIAEVGYGDGFTRAGSPVSVADLAALKLPLPGAPGCYRFAVAVADKGIRSVSVYQPGRGGEDAIAQPRPGLFVSTRSCTHGRQGPPFRFAATGVGALNTQRAIHAAAAVQIYARAETTDDAVVDAEVSAENRAIRRQIADACRACRRPGWQRGSLALEQRFKVDCLSSRGVAPIQCIRE